VDETDFNHVREEKGKVYGGGKSQISLLEAVTNFM
jgi:hypothetical protein